MNLTKLAFKNLLRKRIRTALTVCGIAVAVSVLVSLKGFDVGYQNSLQADIDKMGYQLLVTAKGCPYEAATLMLKGGGGLRYMDEAVYAKIVSDPRIDKITPQLVHTVFDPDKNDGRGGLSMFMGIDPSYLELKPWTRYRSGGWFTSPEAREVLLGYEAAELELRTVGDQIFIPGVDEVLTVAGIFERTGTQDDGIIFMPLRTTQIMFGLESQLTGIGIKLKEIGQIHAFEEDLFDEPGIQIVSMAQVKGTIMSLVSSARVMTSAIALIAILVAVIGVVNTILMSVFERTREIGVLKALGASRWDIFRVIWLETIVVCVLGGAAGNLLAIVTTDLVQQSIKRVLPYAPSGDLVLISPALLAGALAGTIVLGLLAGVYPAFRASSTRPVVAIRMGE